jgi:hypothetical protein
MIHDSTMETVFSCTTFFESTLRGSRDRFFDENKSSPKDLEYTSLLLVFNADFEYHIGFDLICSIYSENLVNMG